MRLARMTVAAALLLPAASARANGRFPAAQSINYQHGGPEVIVGATFGLLVSKTGNRDYRWVCEQAVGYGGFWDPIIQINKNGVIFASTFDGLARSEDGGCSWGFAGGDLLGHWIDGLAVHPADPSFVLAATSSGGRENAIMKSTDAGKTFTMVSGTVSQFQFYKSLMMAPGAPMRVYATSYTITPETATLWKSSNGGQNFVSIDFPFRGGATFKLLAVDSSNPDVVFVRIDGTPPAGGGEPDSIIYRTTNGGLQFTEVYRSPATILSGAVSNDGRTVVLSALAGEIVRSSNGGTTFAPVAGSYSRCAANPNGTLHLCTNPFAQGFAVMTSPSFGAGLDYRGVMTFKDLARPLECPAGAVARWLPEPGSTDEKKRSRATRELCEPLWPTTQVQIGNTAEADAGADAPDAGPRPKDPSTCACRAGARAGGGTGAAWLLLALAVIIRRRTCARRP